MPAARCIICHQCAKRGEDTLDETGEILDLWSCRSYRNSPKTATELLRQSKKNTATRLILPLSIQRSSCCMTKVVWKYTNKRIKNSTRLLMRAKSISKKTVSESTECQKASDNLSGTHFLESANELHRSPGPSFRTIATSTTLESASATSFLRIQPIKGVHCIATATTIATTAAIASAIASAISTTIATTTQMSAEAMRSQLTRPHLSLIHISEP